MRRGRNGQDGSHIHVLALGGWFAIFPKLGTMEEKLGQQYLSPASLSFYRQIP